MKLATFFVLLIALSINSFAAEAPPHPKLLKALSEFDETIQVGIMFTAVSDHSKGLKTLIDNGMPISFPNKSIGYQPIFAAFFSDNKKAVDILLKAGISLKQKYAGYLPEEADRSFTIQEYLEQPDNGLDLRKARKLFNKYYKQ